jgi:hypothetical protein
LDYTRKKFESGLKNTKTKIPLGDCLKSGSQAMIDLQTREKEGVRGRGLN